MINYAIISGSHRAQSQSLKIAHFIKEILKESRVSLIDLADNPLPLWDESVWSADQQWNHLWDPISKKLKEADAIVIVSPEWGGMAPSGLKNLFLLCSKQELSHKPGLIVSVSSGHGGSYPICELRMSSYKNTQFCYIPEHVIVRHAGDVLNDSANHSSKEDLYIRGRLRHALRLLEQYALALRQVRQSEVADYKTYPYGM